MTWPQWLRWPWPRRDDAREAKERAEQALRHTQRQQVQVRKEAQRPIANSEFIDRARRAFE